MDVEDDVIPLLRIWIVSARGLPRSAGAVGMPDPYVIVKFNGDKVSELPHVIPAARAGRAERENPNPTSRRWWCCCIRGFKPKF